MNIETIIELLSHFDPKLLIYGVSSIEVKPPFVYLKDRNGNELEPIDFIKEFDKERKEINGRF